MFFKIYQYSLQKNSNIIYYKKKRFASNRTSGLVLDCGAIHTTAIPIHEGYVLQKAVAQSPLGGEFILSQCRQFLEEQLKIDVVPYYMVKSKVIFFFILNIKTKQII